MTSDVFAGLNHLALLYGDPGSGMLIWQLITAAGIGLLFYARTIVRKIRNLRGHERNEENPTSIENRPNS